MMALRSVSRPTTVRPTRVGYRGIIMILEFQPIIDNDLVDYYKKLIADLIAEQRVGPELRVRDFDDYVCLLNGDVSLYIQIETITLLVATAA